MYDERKSLGIDYVYKINTKLTKIIFHRKNNLTNTLRGNIDHKPTNTV